MLNSVNLEIMIVISFRNQMSAIIQIVIIIVVL